MADLFNRYHRKFEGLFNESDYLFEDKHFQNWSDYVSARIPKENEFKLYYYTTFFRGEGNDTEVDQLYLSSQNNLNDIFEGIGRDANSGFYDERIEENLTDYVVKSKGFAYVKSFSESFNNNLMWSHYANHYKGICIEYDFSRIDSEFWIWQYFFPVKYTNTIEKGIDLSLVYYSLENNSVSGIYDTRGVFTQKSKLWRYEKEWRMVITESDLKGNISEKIRKNGEHLEISFPFVSSVYIGPGLKPKINDVLKSLKNNISQDEPFDVYLMELQGDESYDLRYKKIDEV